ncbi:MAG TPA: methionine adenosyltransferase [Bryobacteraceae bacterium]|jgi:S-adenosylmethionine synthetase
MKSEKLNAVNHSAGMRTAEMVTDGHPDKFCDQVADAILDEALLQDTATRAGIECLIKDNLLVISGEMTTKACVNYEQVAREVWEDVVGYGPGCELAVLSNIKMQSPDIARGAGRDGDGGVDFGGAGDQGIMIGFATTESPSFMPSEYEFARSLAIQLKQLRKSSGVDWLRPDGKTQVTVVQHELKSVIVAAHHESGVSTTAVRETLCKELIEPVLGRIWERPDVHLVINGTGAFTIGGPWSDAGVVGRKIVVDAYGPRIPVGGGAYSGKDPSKVDRSAAYMARHIAKSVVANNLAQECLVTIAYAIGQKQPEMLEVVTSTHTSEAERWVKDHFHDLRPAAIIEYLGLRSPRAWSYRQTAAFGHYGRPEFPWERVASSRMEKPTAVA